MLFFSPLKGEITNHFNLKEGHYGVDVIASKNEAVKAVLSGTVVYNDWTPENGHVIQVQHQQNLISVYKCTYICVYNPTHVGSYSYIQQYTGVYLVVCMFFFYPYWCMHCCMILLADYGD